MQEGKKKIVFIVNPISGTSSKEGFDKVVEKKLDSETLRKQRYEKFRVIGTFIESASTESEAGRTV